MLIQENRKRGTVVISTSQAGRLRFRGLKWDTSVYHSVTQLWLLPRLLHSVSSFCRVVLLPRPAFSCPYNKEVDEWLPSLQLRTSFWFCLAFVPGLQSLSNDLLNGFRAGDKMGLKDIWKPRVVGRGETPHQLCSRFQCSVFHNEKEV